MNSREVLEKRILPEQTVIRFGFHFIMLGLTAVGPEFGRVVLDLVPPTRTIILTEQKPTPSPVISPSPRVILEPTPRGKPIN